MRRSRVIALPRGLESGGSLGGSASPSRAGRDVTGRARVVTRGGGCVRNIVILLGTRPAFAKVRMANVRTSLSGLFPEAHASPSFKYLLLSEREQRTEAPGFGGGRAAGIGATTLFVAAEERDDGQVQVYGGEVLAQRRRGRRAFRPHGDQSTLLGFGRGRSWPIRRLLWRY